MIKINRYFKWIQLATLVLLLLGCVFYATHCRSAESQLARIDLGADKLSDDAREPLTCAQMFTSGSKDAGAKAAICESMFKARSKQKDEQRLQDRLIFCRQFYQLVRKMDPKAELTKDQTVVRELEFALCWSKLNPTK